ncbi:Hypothetical protein, putative [Bodo saltans]|uniref:Uncharacterized protein n=1 Tax=Bodo saltans TaxID=75058 RepID=A0A0S4JB05_BODSA|nr:Hypothetical protein, putative [Bodo saltans]|eukprot:CUG88754.1 Hypothetical protein, putative [Bodo saltans]
MSSTALLQAMVDHIEEADDASAEEVLQIVCEVFIAVFRQPTTTRPSGPPLSVQFASREEPQLEALQLALSLFHKANTAAPTLATLLRSAEHHATSALFLQDTLPIAFPSDASSRGSSSKEMQRTALSLVEVVGLTVGRASCQRLLPGVASAASKYLFAYLPRRGAHCQRRSSLCKAADILTFWIETCFGLPLSLHNNDSIVASSSPQVSWSQQDQHWVSMAAPKLLPLLTRVLDANTIGDVAVGVPATIAQALLSLCGALFRATWHRGVCPAPTARSLVCSIVLLKCVMRGQDGGGGAFDVNSEPMEWHELSSLHTAEILHHSDSTTVGADLSTVASWDALMEFTCSPTQQFGSAYMSALTLMASLATSSTLTSKSRGWRELLANNDGIFLWRLIRRAVRYCTDPHTSLAADDVGLLQQTSQERRLRTASSQQTQHTTKSLMDLLDDLLSAIGKLATNGSGEILESLLDHAEEVLQDWNAYAAHPEVIYVI